MPTPVLAQGFGTPGKIAAPGKQPPPPPERLIPLPHVVALAATDLATLPPAIRCRTRYLTLENIPAKLRTEAAKVLSGHCNQLSRESDISPPAIVSGLILRINLDDYGWDAKTYDSLAEADPYFHIRIAGERTLWPGGVWPGDGLSYPKGAFTYQPKKQTVIAPWLSETPEAKIALAALVSGTQSQAPLLRGEWFFNRTAAQADRKPGYYDFLGIKDEKTFQTLIGFDAKLAETFGKELREAVADSTVTLQPRAMSRNNTLGGGYWRTFDFRKAVDKGNPLRVLGKDVEDAYDATEQFGHLPNGMWATGLFDRGGKRQDSAPDFIASDGFARGTDRRVHVNVSCIRCHANGGLQDIEGWTRNLFQPPLVLQSPDYAIARKLKQQYLRKLEPFLDRDRSVHAEAVREATGMEVKAYHAAYAAMWERYEDAKVDVAYAARDVGVTEEAFVSALSGYLRKTGTLDTVLTGLLRRRVIGIRQWEEVFPLAMYAVRGYQP